MPAASPRLARSALARAATAFAALALLLAPLAASVSHEHRAPQFPEQKTRLIDGCAGKHGGAEYDGDGARTCAACALLALLSSADLSRVPPAKAAPDTVDGVADRGLAWPPDGQHMLVRTRGPPRT